MERTENIDISLPEESQFLVLRKRLYSDQVRENCGASLLLYAISRWRVFRANAKKHLEMISKVSEWVKQNRNKCYFKRSTYSLLKTEDPSTETWMNIDEYKDQESYERFTKIFQESNPDYGGLFKIEEEVVSLLVPNSLTREVYIEKPELSVSEETHSRTESNYAQNQ